MKSKTSKELIIFIIIIPLFLAASFFITSRMDQALPDYSAINKAKKGYSVFFETLKELDYPIDRTFTKVELHDIDSLQVVHQHKQFDINSQEVKDWVGKGGSLVYLTEEIKENMNPYGVKVKERDGVSHYQYKRGFIIVADGDYLTNEALVKDTSGAYRVVEAMDEQTYEKIYFNEFYLYSVTDKVSLWSQIPMAWKFLIYQAGLVLIAFFYYKGKAFGKPIPLHEEVERIENEYLYASASLYRQAKSWDLMLEIYYKSFLKEIGSNHEGWLQVWKKEDLPHLGRAQNLQEFMSNRRIKAKTNVKTKEKEYMQMVITLDQLRNVLKKRRDTSWKITN